MRNDIQRLNVVFNAGTYRVETGVVQFNDDWPGVFIRGDNAAYFAMNLEIVLKAAMKHPEIQKELGVFAPLVTEALLSLLQGCIIQPNAE